ncbi:XrtA-associated tyrosine autokinase [Sphaerotilus uruguayifluvii]|uniref:Receptor protein-tyrosine kinase n=1 Tax=Sphaerotilus uruguayifluvii TaxID=2735897 RepID=A0ABX2G313_9BURK|nr:XrtA-associated tyrosine autokinase [Leptothrix sp. C29]NRT55672.1 receptor protein-tyrosine kinase [Leptothrix sp. C29]
MNTIEQAAKRLAELKRAGYDVPVPDMPGGSPAAQPGATPAVPLPAEAGPAGASAPAAVAAVAAAPAVPAVRSAQVEMLPSSGRRSREVMIDVARLEREGYLVPTQARSQLAEQMRIIKRPLLANARGETAQHIPRANLIQVVSAMPGEGKTFFAINLAMSIAMEVDLSVLLVDADVLRPSVLARCGIEPSRGLMDVLKSPSLDLADVMLRTNVPKLTLLPAGTANAQSTELLASAAMEKLLDELASRFPDRIIVFDAPPLIPTTESRVLASRVGQVVMVVEAGKTTHGQVTQAYAAVEQCPIVLSVLNRASTKSNEAYGYYYAT